MSLAPPPADPPPRESEAAERPSPPPPPARVSPLAPLRYPAFRAIWSAMVLSSLGATIQAVGAAWLMTELTDSHLLVSLVQATSTLPMLLLGLIAGAIADNHDRRLVMLAAQAVMLTASTALAALTFAGEVGPASLLLLTLAVGLGSALNAPAWQASIRQQVGPAEVPQAVSLNAIAFNLARSVGPAMGGLLIAALSVAWAFALNAASYIAMIVALLTWKPRGQTPQRARIGAAIREGLVFALGSRPIRRVLLRGVTFGFGAVAVQALLPLVARDRLGGDQVDYGLLLTGFGVGSIMVALWVSRLRRRFGSEAVVTTATLASAAGLALLSNARELAPAFAAVLISGAGWVAALTSLNVAVQVRAPEAILGRCLSMYQTATFGGLALGAWAWGAFADVVGVPTTLATAAGLMAALALLLHVTIPMPGPQEGRVDIEPRPDDPLP